MIRTHQCLLTRSGTCDAKVGMHDTKVSNPRVVRISTNQDSRTDREVVHELVRRICIGHQYHTIYRVIWFVRVLRAGKLDQVDWHVLTYIATVHWDRCQSY